MWFYSIPQYAIEYLQQAAEGGGVGAANALLGRVSYLLHVAHVTS